MLSSSVANALRLTGGPEAHETCNFIEKMDKFFDCFNVSSYTAGRKARKEFQKPYTKPTDFRLNVSTVYNPHTYIVGDPKGTLLSGKSGHLDNLGDLC